jgi:hypothetical protein
MTSESDNQATNPLESPPPEFDNPGNQALCLLIRVSDTPQGLVASPDPAVVAEDDVVLWFAEPGLGAFNIGLEADNVLEVRAVGDTKALVPFVAAGAKKEVLKGKDMPMHVWRAGASHLVSARPKQGVPTSLRYRLWKADGGRPGKAMTLFVSPPRRQVFGTSGTVRPENTP